MVLDVIWKARNDVVFNNTNRDSHTMACVVKNTMIGINRAKDMYRRTNEPTPSTSATSHIRWTPPMHGWIKLNCDGARSTSHGKATSGGIFCNDNGGFCFGFSVSLGDCSILSAELWAVLYGVRFAWARGYTKIMIESDSLLAVNLIVNGCSTRHPCYSFVHQIQALSISNITVQWKHIFCEANQAADCLAKLGLSQDDRVRVFEQELSCLELILVADRNSVSFSHDF